jgi:hypothetical protein
MQVYDAVSFKRSHTQKHNKRLIFCDLIQTPRQRIS